MKKKTENILEHFGCNTNLVKSHLNAWFPLTFQNENRHFIIVDGYAVPSLVCVVFVFLDRNLFLHNTVFNATETNIWKCFSTTFFLI